MVLKPKASLGFKQDEPAVKVEFGGGVINSLEAAEAMPENPFPNLPVKVADLQAANDLLRTTGAAAKSGAFSDQEAYDLALIDWDQKFSLTAAYVSFQASSAVLPSQVIRWGGFVPTKGETTPRALPAATETARAYNNSKRRAIIAESQKKIDFANGYVFAFAPAAATVEFQDNVMKITIGTETVYISAGTKKSVELYNLPQTPLNVYMYGFNAAGSGPASQPVTVTPGILNNDQKPS